MCLFYWGEDPNAPRNTVVQLRKTWLKIFPFLISHTTSHECFVRTADVSLFTGISYNFYFEAGFTSVKESKRRYLLWLQSKIINVILASYSIYILSWLTDITFTAICSFPRKGNPGKGKLWKREIIRFLELQINFSIIMVINVFQNVILKKGLNKFLYKKLSRTVWVEKSDRKWCNILIVSTKLFPLSSMFY